MEVKMMSDKDIVSYLIGRETVWSKVIKKL
jgi:hypothetical protein